MVALRYKDWKGVFREMTYPGGFDVWRQQFNCLRVPKLFNLRMDPRERAAIVSDQYDDWMNKNGYLLGEMIFNASGFLETFIDYLQPLGSQRDMNRQCSVPPMTIFETNDERSFGSKWPGEFNIMLTASDWE
jgi:hypothetical protein